jgi:hypothetical protein
LRIFIDSQARKATLLLDPDVNFLSLSAIPAGFVGFIFDRREIEAATLPPKSVANREVRIDPNAQSATARGVSSV